MNTSHLVLLAASLLLAPSASFAPSTRTNSIVGLQASSSSSDDNPYPRINQEILSELTPLPPTANHLPFINEALHRNLPTTSSSSTTSTPSNEEHNAARSIEFILDDNTPPPSPRLLAKLELESRLRAIYTPVNSNTYWELQDEILQLESDLSVAKSHTSRYHGESEGIKAIQTMLRRAQAKDAQHVYGVTARAARVAERMGRYQEAERYRVESGRARRMLPQFQLEGLWVGK
jgi:hypothetical protein